MNLFRNSMYTCDVELEPQTECDVVRGKLDYSRSSGKLETVKGKSDRSARKQQQWLVKKVPLNSLYQCSL